ncbi:WD40 repeat domain-containing protein [Crocosphaera chwakensis]|uniref:Beta transducin-like protein n=1 Tax=Crocosphaera chwakensis CCY0110 TaxID=391612 RepID=A3IPI2_9CHRO|nr:WD40 repeat domain-containing protein [Crocosphaera chwakensis]EAZ91747.1 beta transducin-like protein [Crocosphaera chwakensis CCY0110]
MIRQANYIKSLSSVIAGIGVALTLNYSIIGSKVSAQVPLSQSRDYLAQANITVEDLQGFNGVVKSLAITPDGKLLLVGTGDGELTAIDLETKETLYSKAVLVNNYSSIAFNVEKDILVVGDDQTVMVLSLSTGQKLSFLREHTGKVSDVAISPDGNNIVSVSGDDQTIRIWDLESGELIKTIGANIGPTTSVQYTPDGTMFITGAIGSDRTLKFWDATTFKLLNTSSQQPGFINDLKISNDGTQLVAAVRNFVKSWDLTTLQQVWSTKGPKLEINTIAVSPDNRTVATANKEGTIMLFDLATGRKLATLQGHRGWVLSLAFSRDGQYLYSGAEDKMVKVWQLQPY